MALFSRQGYHGTSTREIARLADVSEVTLYRYFEHKEDIFWSALISCFEGLGPRLGSLDPGARNAMPEVVLPRILSMMIDTATFSPELIRLIAVALLEVRGRAEEVCREHLTPLFTAISNYLAVNIQAGKVRNLDPAITTLAIASTAFAQSSLSTLVMGSRLSTFDSRQTIDAYTAFWLGVLAPPLPDCAAEILPKAETIAQS